MSENNQTRKNRNYTRQQFLLTFFDGDGYETKEVNGFVLVKHLNGNTGGYEVAIYTEEAFKNYNYSKEANQDKVEAISLLDRIMRNG